MEVLLIECHVIPHPKSSYKLLSSIATEIENGRAYCLQFFEFHSVIQFLRNMEFTEFEAISPELYGRNIFSARMHCCSGCSAAYQITIDLVHQIVFIVLKGSHRDDCHKFQKKIGYPFVKNLMTHPEDIYKRVENYPGEVDEKILNYYGGNEYKISTKPVRFEIVDLKFQKNYNSNIENLIYLITTQNKFYTLKPNGPILNKDSEICKDMIIEPIVNDGYKGIAMGGKQQLKRVGIQTNFCVSVVHGKIFPDFDFILVGFTDDETGQFTIACSGFVQHTAENSQITQFIKVFKEMVRKTTLNAFSILSLIVVDDRLHIPLFSTEFPLAYVQESIRTLVLESFDFLDGMGQEMMIEAMFEKNPVKCLAKIDALILLYKERSTQ